MSPFSTRACCAVALAAAVAAPPARAQQPSGDELALFALDDLLSKETAIASRRAKTLRESPGIVTIVTRDEIRDSGARDLADVLLAVPGFQIGGEVANSTGVGFRGMWAAEGKVLVLVDGVILNDLLYGQAQVDAFPIDDVQQVEIVRGPGSAMYGGFAELAVVNVVTRSGAGAAATATYGQLDHGLGRRSLSLAYGKEGDGWSVRGYASGGQSVRGSGTYVDGSGVSFPMSQDALDDVAVNVGATVGKLALRVLHDRWGNRSRDFWGDTLPEPYRQRWTTTAADARYELALGETLRLLPQATFLRSTPFQVADQGMFDKTVDRYAARLALAWDPAGSLSVTAGGEAFTEEERLNQPTNDTNFLPDGKSSFSSYNVAAYAEAAWDAPFANLLVGGRYEHHSRFGDSFVPRVAVTKLLEPFHLKLLYANAFRAPAAENMTSNPDIRPERTRSFEAEVGWRAAEGTYLAVNAFYARIDDAIVYNTVESGGNTVDQYANYAQSGAHGVELDLRHQAGWGAANLCYSFYTTASSNKVDVYAVPGHDDEMLGFAAHKVSARATVRVGHDVTVAPALTFLSDRYGYTSYDASGAPVLGHVGPKLTADLFVTWRNAFVRGLELGAGVHDLFDGGTVYVTPYRPTATVHAFLPGPGREVLLRVGYGG